MHVHCLHDGHMNVDCEIVLQPTRIVMRPCLGWCSLIWSHFCVYIKAILAVVTMACRHDMHLHASTM